VSKMGINDDGINFGFLVRFSFRVGAFSAPIFFQCFTSPQKKGKGN